MSGGRGWVLFAFSVLYGCRAPETPAAGGGCIYAADCADGESCVEGFCLPIARPAIPEKTGATTRECTSYAHCPTDLPNSKDGIDVKEGPFEDAQVDAGSVDAEATDAEPNDAEAPDADPIDLGPIDVGPLPLGEICTVDQDCQSSVCWDVGTGDRCIRSCNSPLDCDNGTTCHVLNGARICLPPAHAPTTAEDVDCTTDGDCQSGLLCAWIEDAPGHFDQVCRSPIGNGGPQSGCNSGADCANGVCTPGVQSGGAYCRYTCATDSDCPNGFACLYIEYDGQTYVQAVKACLPLASPQPPVCGVDGDCASDQKCTVFDGGTNGTFTYWSNVCL